MPLVMNATDTESREFTFFENSTGIGQVWIGTHAGGTWVLEFLAPEADAWLETDVSFTTTGVQAFYYLAHASYRITGGTVGATAGAYPVIAVGS